MNRLVVMGVTGSGKSTVGPELAAMLRVPFADGDEFHVPAAIRKMAAGIPLSDDDREPWLRTLGAWLRSHQAGAIVGCSALRRCYRDLLRALAGDILFVHLAVEPSTVERRLGLRRDHFMPRTLISSQFADLEELEPDERGLRVDGTRPPEEICAAVRDYVSRSFPSTPLGLSGQHSSGTLGR